MEFTKLLGLICLVKWAPAFLLLSFIYGTLKDIFTTDYISAGLK